ncbi:MAG: MlaC/ttg2D family ABC transporter substrate-binding protein [Burkholderiales bacterium]
MASPLDTTVSFNRRTWVAALLGGAALALTAAPALAQAPAADAPPDTLARSVTEDVMKALRTDKDIAAGNQKKLTDLVETKILPYFDFAQMTQLAMGRNWREASADQRKAVTAEFRTLLVRTYSTALSTYKNQTVDYKPVKLAPGDTRVTVRSAINQDGGGPPISMDLRMEKQAGGWKVYDVAIENVSLLENWRSQFNTQIQKNGVDGLIKALADLNKTRGTQS